MPSQPLSRNHVLPLPARKIFTGDFAVSRHSTRAPDADVSSVTVRLWDSNASDERLVPMDLAARDVSCFQASLAHDSCDFWQTTLPDPAANVLWYRFVVTDGTASTYYADDTPALD